MKAFFQYHKYLAKHKYHVLRFGLKTGAPLWRLLIHDWSKYRPDEFGPYMHYFYGGRQDSIKSLFNRSWAWHIRRNPHHHQHWLMVQKPFCRCWTGNFRRVVETPLLCNDDGTARCLGCGAVYTPMSFFAERMPDHFVKEMVADWASAGYTIHGKLEVREWYAQNKDSMKLHPHTRGAVEALLQHF